MGSERELNERIRREASAMAQSRRERIAREFCAWMFEEGLLSEEFNADRDPARLAAKLAELEREESR